jgi:carboxypeptidase Taq
MLDEFEVGMSQSRIDEIFDEVQSTLVPLIAEVLASKNAPSSEPLEGTFDVSKQQELSEKLVTAIGFDRNNGRIDVSVHPFTSSISASDVRITSRFRQDEWYQGLAGTIHEGGHAIYEQNLVPSALSIDSALSMGTHESQSLFWERHIGLSKPFWKFAYPLLKDLDGSFERYSPEEVYGAVNRVSQSFIRVEADELTYPLHVILRYNIEKDVISGKLNVEDISSRWNYDMKKLLNIEVPSDDKGALQDVHWSGLAFGYFPTYLLGAIAAAQLFHYCQKDLPDLETKIENGEFEPMKAWLKSKIHKHGRRYQSLDAMLEDQLGEALNPKYFIDYLTSKYTDLYKLHDH